jgi:hypothetical protein
MSALNFCDVSIKFEKAILVLKGRNHLNANTKNTDTGFPVRVLLCKTANHPNRSKKAILVLNEEGKPF